jgi:hypothetical protein
MPSAGLIEMPLSGNFTDEHKVTLSALAAAVLQATELRRFLTALGYPNNRPMLSFSISLRSDVVSDSLWHLVRLLGQDGGGHLIDGRLINERANWPTSRMRLISALAGPPLPARLLARSVTLVTSRRRFLGLEFAKLIQR